VLVEIERTVDVIWLFTASFRKHFFVFGSKVRNEEVAAPKPLTE
jgi:hypothetical protein